MLQLRGVTRTQAHSYHGPRLLKLMRAVCAEEGRERGCGCACSALPKEVKAKERETAGQCFHTLDTPDTLYKPQIGDIIAQQ